MKGFRQVDYDEPRPEPKPQREKLGWFDAPPAQPWGARAAAPPRVDPPPPVSPPAGTVTRAEKAAAELLIQITEELGEPVDIRLRQVMKAPVWSVKRSPGETLRELRKACDGLSKAAEAAPSRGMQLGIVHAVAVIKAVLDGGA